MTDTPFTETHRATLLWMGGILAHRGQRDASNAAIKEIERLTRLVQACGNTECVSRKKFDRLRAACEDVASWLCSFAMPPTATITEKDEQLAALEAVLETT